MPLSFSLQPLDDQLKLHLYEDFRQHSLETMNVDGLQGPVSCIAYKKEEFAGAIVFTPFWGALHIKYLFVEKNYRYQGIGKALITQALQFANTHQLSFVFVETMSFQALEFYKKCGFNLEFTRKGYAQETSLHYLRLDLVKN